MSDEPGQVGNQAALNRLPLCGGFFYYLFMTKEKDEVYMKEALKEAALAFDEGEVPVGAVVVRDDVIVGRGHNHKERDLDISSHAEIVAIKEAAKTLGRWSLEDCSLYVTLEPCLMCAGAILQSRIRFLSFGALDPAAGSILSAYHVFDEKNAYTPPLIDKGLRNNECSDLLLRFFKSKR